MKWWNECFSLCVVVDVRLDIEHLQQRGVEEAVFIQNVSNHPQGATTQVALLHQILLSAPNCCFHTDLFHSDPHSEESN